MPKLCPRYDRDMPKIYPPQFFSIIYLAWIQGASAPWHELWQQKQRVSSKLVMTRFQSTLLSWLKAYRMNDRVWKLLTLDLKQSSRVRLLTVWSRSKFVYTKLLETGVKYCLCWACIWLWLHPSHTAGYCSLYFAGSSSAGSSSPTEDASPGLRWWSAPEWRFSHGEYPVLSL